MTCRSNIALTEVFGWMGLLPQNAVMITLGVTGVNFWVFAPARPERTIGHNSSLRRRAA